tara:strand:- start:122 stop:271 length:150 start_codon:yes stop_codon:yes gene_type:complete
LSIYFFCFLSRKKENENINPEELGKNGEDYPENSGCPNCFLGLKEGVIV